jgi:type I restriction enzyme M protein
LKDRKGSEAEEEDGVPFEEKMKVLPEELARQFEEGAVLKQRVRESLQGYKY